MMDVQTKTPTLIVTVDTEEEGLWQGTFSRGPHTVENLKGIPRFQHLCNSYGIRPTYLIDTPVVQHPSSVSMLRDYLKSGFCEIGTHLHPWCAPPFQESLSAFNSYQCNLPRSLQREKLLRLTDAITSAVGQSPSSFRAGRYGLDAVGAQLLIEAGYQVDSSVLPYFDYREEGGPNFQSAACKPYWFDGEDLCQTGTSGQLLEVPVSAGFNWCDFSKAQAWRTWLGSSWRRAARLTGIFDRLGWLQQIKFSPEKYSASQMQTLVDLYHAQDAPCMVMLLHSTSLLPGFSPYAADDSTCETLYQSMEAIFRYCREFKEMSTATLTEFAANWHPQEKQHDLLYA
ncbi:Hypothetical protein PBC10988_8630 [Planctomycetales bacterium 10988]|nr:Hypothetical protein PBC10988_8630 [Planctomycetales bacterium 10988]